MKTVTVTLDKERQLKFGVKAFLAIEKAAGVPMEKLDYNMQESLFILLLGGLIHNDRKLTLDKVIDLVDKKVEKVAADEKIGFMEAYGKVMQELGEALGEAMNDNENPTP